MLTGFQTEVVAFILDADNPCPICPRCAALATSSVTVEKAALGLDNAFGLRPVIRYTADQYAGEDGDGLACDRCYEWIVQPDPLVRAFYNDGEWCPAPDEPGVEAAAGPCDACGSVGPDGEPGPGFILGDSDDVVVCGCCGDERDVDSRPRAEVVF